MNILIIFLILGAITWIIIAAIEPYYGNILSSPSKRDLLTKRFTNQWLVRAHRSALARAVHRSERKFGAPWSLRSAGWSFAIAAFYVPSLLVIAVLTGGPEILVDILVKNKCWELPDWLSIEISKTPIGDFRIGNLIKTIVINPSIFGSITVAAFAIIFFYKFQILGYAGKFIWIVILSIIIIFYVYNTAILFEISAIIGIFIFSLTSAIFGTIIADKGTKLFFSPRAYSFTIKYTIASFLAFFGIIFGALALPSAILSISALISININAQYNESLLSILIVSLLLPISNGFVDYLSFSLAQAGCKKLVKKTPTTLAIIGHMVYSAVLSIVLVTLAAILIAIVFSELQFSKEEKINTQQFILKSASEPLGYGLWYTLMVITPLFWTVIYFLSATGALFVKILSLSQIDDWALKRLKSYAPDKIHSLRQYMAARWPVTAYVSCLLLIIPTIGLDAAAQLVLTYLTHPGEQDGLIGLVEYATLSIVENRARH